MMERVSSKLGDRRAVAVFHTDCAARGRALFNKVLKEEIVNRTQMPLCGDTTVPWLGMYGFGELTTQLGGRNRFHNYTTSLYCIVNKA